ncbi:hypothetical protein BS17DRAFT_822911 [Gyrodon lividus]|nr:hypothetical protein BS17DRAFT_822911 [Gyrodon lividus]
MVFIPLIFGYLSRTVPTLDILKKEYQNPTRCKDLPPDSSTEDNSPESFKSSDCDLTEPKNPDDKFSVTEPTDLNNKPTMASKAPELKIGTPSVFDGNTDDAVQWMHSVISYFKLNDHVYNSNKKKIIATLSFMNKGTTASWAEAYYENAANKGWGKWTDFIKNFKTTFAVSDVKGTALTGLTSLTQRHCGSLEKFNTEF